MVVVGEEFVDDVHERRLLGRRGLPREGNRFADHDKKCFHELLDFEVESGFRFLVVGLAVEAVEASGAVGDVLFDFVGLFEDFEFQEFFAEVAFVEGLAKDAFVEALQLSEGEFAGEKLESNGAVPQFGTDAFLGGGEDFGVVESEVWKVVEGKPSGIVGVGGSGGRVFVEIDEGVVRNGDDVLAGITLRLSEGIELFEIDLPEAGFFFEFAPRAGIKVFSNSDKASGESPLPFKGGEASFDKEDLEVIVIETEDHAVGGKGWAGEFVRVHAPMLVSFLHLASKRCLFHT